MALASEEHNGVFTDLSALVWEIADALYFFEGQDWRDDPLHLGIASCAFPGDVNLAATFQRVRWSADVLNPTEVAIEVIRVDGDAILPAHYHAHSDGVIAPIIMPRAPRCSSKVRLLGSLSGRVGQIADLELDCLYFLPRNFVHGMQNDPNRPPAHVLSVQTRSVEEDTFLFRS